MTKGQRLERLKSKDSVLWWWSQRSILLQPTRGKAVICCTCLLFILLDLLHVRIIIIYNIPESSGSPVRK
jgi:hypothetical protein